MNQLLKLLVIGASSLGLLSSTAADRPAPSKSDESYGEHPSQKLDVYLPEGTGPFPVALFIHGGGWGSGDKVEKLKPEMLQKLLSNGCAVVSINYQFIVDAKQAGIFPPVLVPLNDSKRAVQYVRAHAAEWRLDGSRVALFGGSAGGYTSLWIGLSPEMGDPNSSDPVARQSTRVRAVAAFSPQTSIDPAQMREWVGPELTYGGHAFGVSNFTEFLQRRAEFESYFPKLSPASLVDAQSPPLFLEYGQGLTPAKADANYFTHSPRFGIGFAELARSRGATCYLKYPGHAPEGNDPDALSFLVSELKK